MSSFCPAASPSACLRRRRSSQPKPVPVIGISQFPQSFNPLVDAAGGEGIVLGFARDNFTESSLTRTWKLVFMLCRRLPTIENGLAVPKPCPTATGALG